MRGSADVHAAGLPRPAGDFDTVAQTELGLDVRQVRLHRAERDEQLVADLLIRTAAGDDHDDLLLTIGENVCAVAAGCACIGEVLKEKMKGVRICAVEPASSPVIAGGEPGYHKIQGIGAGFIPAVLNRNVLDEIISVSDEEATQHTRRLAAEEGLLVGISSGAACCAALKVAQKLGKGHVVVTLFADKGEHYLSTDLFSDKKWTQSSVT